MDPNQAAELVRRVRFERMELVLSYFESLGNQARACKFIERTVIVDDQALYGIVLLVSDDVQSAWKRSLINQGHPAERWHEELNVVLQATQQGASMASQDLAKVDDESQAIHDAFREAWSIAISKTALSSLPFKVRFNAHGSPIVNGLSVFVFSLARGSNK